MSLSELPGRAKSRFLAGFIPNLLGALPGCAVTGKLNNDRIESVDGVEQKLEAIRDHTDIRRVIIPKENDSSSTRASSILTPLSTRVPRECHARVLTALWSLVPLRKTWLILNVALVIAAAVSVTQGPALLHALVLRPITVERIQTSLGSFSIKDLDAEGIKLRGSDHVRILVNAHTLDGLTIVRAACPREGAAWAEKQCLRPSLDTGDWRSEVNVPVVDGVASFDFMRGDIGRESCRMMTLSLIHRQSEIWKLVLPISEAAEQPSM
jgi:hypothetical protein